MSTSDAVERMDVESMGLERRLTDWLAREGPQDVPERVVDAALAQARTVARLGPRPRLLAGLLKPAFPSGQARGTSLALRRPLMRAWAVLLATLVVVLAVALLGFGALLVSERAATRNGEVAFDAGGDIWLVDPASAVAPRNLTLTPHIQEGNPVWSPDGRLLAYWAVREAGAEVHVVDAQGAHVRTLTAPPELVLPSKASTFSWSPDGSQIAVSARGSVIEDSRTRVSVEMVVVFDLGTGDGRRVETDVEGPSFGWSPDGRLIGLVGDFALYVVPTDGSGARMLSNRWRSGSLDQRWLRVAWPSFALDGRAILYAAEVALPRWGEGEEPPFMDPLKERFDGDIFMASTDGLDEPTTLVGGPTNDVAPRLSPDGRSLAFGRSTSVTVFGAVVGSKAPQDDPTRVDLHVVEMAALIGDSAEGALVPLAEDIWPDVVWAPDSRQLVTKSATWDELLILDRERPGSMVRIPAGEGALIGGYSWRPMPP